MITNENRVELGQGMWDTALKKALQSLNPGVHFDMGACLNIYHPNMDIWQGVFFRGKHVGSMDRGWIPEYNVYDMVRRPDGKKDYRKVNRIGWRTTLQRIVNKRIPGVTWDTLCPALNIEYKHFRGHKSEIEVAA